MKKFIYLIPFLFAGFIYSGCARFDEMNRDNYVVYDAPAESYVQSILYKTEYTVMKMSYGLLSNIMQHGVNTNINNTAMLHYNYDIDESSTAMLWSLYAQKGNAESMLVEAEKSNNPAMVGVALILRTFVMQIITDTYGNVPYFQAGFMPQQSSDYVYNIPYDQQKEIYIDMFRSLERANAAFDEEGAKNFKASLDYTYEGDIKKWRKFGNALYLRLLMRVSLKVLEESNGRLELGDEYGTLHVTKRIAELYECFVNGSGVYPMISSVDDRAKAKFSKTDSFLYTPFYSTTSGIWNAQAACATLTDKMIVKNDSGKETMRDPRLNYYYSGPKGAPVQLSNVDMKLAIDKGVHGFAAGGNYGDVKNGEWYPLLNYSEVLFNFAEAAKRGWISVTDKQMKQLYLDACKASMTEWNPDDKVPSSPGTTREQYLTYLDGKFDYDIALEEILTQKWIASFWCGVEAWADYRRTGYPILKTNGPAAENNGILCTRLRYPATEAYQNGKYYQEAVTDWLGGENDMLTDVWWADTDESRNNRRKGRQ